MTHHPHDKLAKVVIETLAQGREVSFETEMWPRLRDDVIVSSGQPLPEFTGLLGALLGDTTGLEFYRGRPTLEDLLHIRAKGALLLAREVANARETEGARKVQMVIVTVGEPRRAFGTAYRGADWVQVERGYRRWEGPELHIHLDLLRLRVDLETAWLHLAGNSPHLEEALSLLLRSDYNEVHGMLERLKEEVSFMPSIQESIPAERDKSGAIRFLRAWERVEIHQEGRQEGREEGRQEGREEGLLEEARRFAERLLSRRFSISRDSISALCKDFSSPEQLETLVDRGLNARSAQELASIAELIRADQE